MHIFYLGLRLLPLGWIINGVLTYSTANSAYPKNSFPEYRKAYFKRSFVLMLAGSLLFIISDGFLAWLLSTTQVWQQLSPVLSSIYLTIGSTLSSASSSEWLIVIVLCGLVG